MIHAVVLTCVKCQHNFVSFWYKWRTKQNRIGTSPFLTWVQNGRITPICFQSSCIGTPLLFFVNSFTYFSSWKLYSSKVFSCFGAATNIKYVEFQQVLTSRQSEPFDNEMSCCTHITHLLTRSPPISSETNSSTILRNKFF
jgi:hypothetical protein